jgi:hypothetical protein
LSKFPDTGLTNSFDRCGKHPIKDKIVPDVASKIIGILRPHKYAVEKSNHAMKPDAISIPEETVVPAPAQEPSVADALPSNRDTQLALGSALAYFLLYQITPRIGLTHINIVGATTFLSLVIVLLFTVSAARAIRSWRGILINATISSALSLPPILQALFGPQFLEPLFTSPPMELYKQLMNISGVLALVLVWFAVSLGVLLSRLVREFKILLPIGIVLALMDIYVVFGGGLVTKVRQGDAPPVVNKVFDILTVKLPTAPPSGGAQPMNLAVGFADFLFISMFFACFLRFGIPSRRTFLILSTVLVLYMLAVVVTGLALPALIPIAVICIGMNLRHFRYERSEAFALLYAGILVGGILTALFFFSKR